MEKLSFKLSLVFLNIFFIEASCRDSSISTEEFHVMVDKIKNLEQKNKNLEEESKKLNDNYNNILAKLATAESEIIKLTPRKPI